MIFGHLHFFGLENKFKREKQNLEKHMVTTVFSPFMQHCGDISYIVFIKLIILLHSSSLFFIKQLVPELHCFLSTSK